MSSSLDVCFADYDFLLLSSGRERKQPAKILFHNIRHHSWQPWAGFTGRRKSLFPCQSRGNAIPHTLTSVQPAAGPSEGREARMDGRGKEGGKALKNKSDCKEESLWVLCHRCQSTADSNFGHPNVLAIKFWENALAHAHARRWRNCRNTVICFSLLRNLLSCLQACTSSSSPPFLPSAVFPTAQTVNARRVRHARHLQTCGRKTSGQPCIFRFDIQTDLLLKLHNDRFMQTRVESDENVT